MIAQSVAHHVAIGGHSALFISAAQLLLNLGSQESARALDRRLELYAKIGLLILDEIGFLAFDNRNADLLFQVRGTADATSTARRTTRCKRNGPEHDCLRCSSRH